MTSTFSCKYRKEYISITESLYCIAEIGTTL